MKQANPFRFVFIMSFICLMSGVFNYLLFQPDIIMFKYFGFELTSIAIKNNLIRHFLTGYLSDSLWCISLYLIAFSFAELGYINFQGKILLLLLPLFTEVLQSYRIIRGTFDWYDVLTYVTIIALFIMFYPSLKTTVYEKI